MTEAVFGLLGVLIGGLLTGGIDYLMRRREERQMMRALARSLHADFVELRSKYVYCAELGNWMLLDAEDASFSSKAWQDHELVLGRFMTWKQWIGLQAVHGAQLAVRLLAQQSATQSELQQTHLPTVTAAAIDTIDNILPDLERLAGASRAASGQKVPATN